MAASFTPDTPLGRLVSACRRGDVDGVRERLSALEDLNARMPPPYSGDTPLSASMQDASHAVTRLLLEAGADPDVVPAYGGPLLHQAAMRGQSALVELLLDHGADPLATDEDGRTAWQCARHSPHVRRLLEARGGGPTAELALLDDLEQRLQRGSPEPLPDAGAAFAPLAQRPEAPQLLGQALSSGIPETFFELRALGFPLPEGVEEIGLLERAMAAARADVVEHLLAAGVALDRPGPSGMIPLHGILTYPPTRNAVAMAERLLAAGSPVTAATEDGDTLRARARANGYTMLLDRLPPDAGEVPVDPTAADVHCLEIDLGQRGRERETYRYFPNGTLRPWLFLALDIRGEGGGYSFVAPGRDVRPGRPWTELEADLDAHGLSWLHPLRRSWEAGAPMPFAEVDVLVRRHLDEGAFAIVPLDRSRL